MSTPITVTPPIPPSAPSLPSSDSGSSSESPLPGGKWARVSTSLLAWATFAVITYAWLMTAKLDKAPWWGVIGTLVLNALPGGVIKDLGKTALTALIAKIPGKKETQ